MAELIPGTLDLLILRTLSAGADHGYGVARRIRQVTEDVLQVEEGTLYPALHKLERRDLLESEWRTSEANRRARYYRITRSGRRHLAAETGRWERLSGAVAKVLAAPPI